MDDLQKRMSDTEIESSSDFDDPDVSSRIESIWGSQQSSSPEDGPEASSSTTTENSEEEKKKKKGGIQFGEVRVREHERVLDKRTSTMNGLALGWAHRTSTRFDIDDFEQKKIEENHEKKKLKHYERVQVLSKYGYKPKDVIKAEQDRKKVSERRHQGLPDLPVEEEPSKGKRNKSPKSSRSRSPVPTRLVTGLFSSLGKKKQESTTTVA